jgi:plasmid stability protein
MSVLTVTDVPDEVVAELQRRAAEHGVSMEDEARQVLRKAVPVTEAEGFKAHLLSLEGTAEDFEVPQRAKARHFVFED